MENEVRSRNDFAPEAPPPPPRGTSLPPAGKVAREVSHGIRDIGIPLMALLAAKWGLVGGDVFLFAVSVVLGGNFALRRGEHPER